jgi:hypothetical protein
MTDEIEALFAESLAAKTAGDGLGIRFGDGPEFVVWWSRVKIGDGPTVRRLIGCSINTLRLEFASEFEVEHLVRFIALARWQAGTDPGSVDLDAILAYVESQIWEHHNVPQHRVLRVDDGVNRDDDGAVLVGAEDAGAGPE